MKLLIGILCILSGIVAITALRPKNSEKVLNEPPNAATSSYRTMPVLVELFTSEGCSSCPPADALLSKLVNAETIPGVDVIALGEHVDYWNNLGWRDPYSKADFSQRQRDYSSAFNLKSVYTPQMIVDGHEEFVGGDWNRARAAIVKAAQTPKGHIDLTFPPEADLDQNSPVRRLAIQVKDLPSRSDDADVLFAITENNLQTQVSRGENSGRYLHHSAVVRELNVIGHIVASDEAFVIERSINISPGWRTENLRVIAFVQERRSHRILAVGDLPWK